MAEQNLKNHTRIVPIFHMGVGFPVIINFFWTIYKLVQDPSGETVHGKAELLEHRREQHVLLETVAAPAAVDELRLQCVQVEMDRPTEQDIEVLKWDVRCVRQVDRFEHRPGRPVLAI